MHQPAAVGSCLLALLVAFAIGCTGVEAQSASKQTKRKACGRLVVSCQKYLLTDYDTQPEPWSWAYVSVVTGDSVVMRSQADSLGMAVFECVAPGKYVARVHHVSKPASYDRFVQGTVRVGSGAAASIALTDTLMDLLGPDQVDHK